MTLSEDLSRQIHVLWQMKKEAEHLNVKLDGSCLGNTRPLHEIE